jgi:hypothetical protein
MPIVGKKKIEAWISLLDVKLNAVPRGLLDEARDHKPPSLQDGPW